MATIYINRSDSQCGQCRGNAKPGEKSHIYGGPKSGCNRNSWLSETNGCGAVFDDCVDNYGGNSCQEFGYTAS